MLCSICEKRKAARFCAAKGEKICALCCGREREVLIDCPVDCAYLVTAHRYEDQHPREIPAGTPLLDVPLPSDLIHTHQQFIALLLLTIAKFCAATRAATDGDVLHTLEALAETYKTLSSGIYYEKQPIFPLARELYGVVQQFIGELKQQAVRASVAGPNDSEIFYSLVFVYRMSMLHTNGRPRSRRLIELLRSQLHDAPELKREESRIIVP